MRLCVSNPDEKSNSMGKYSSDVNVFSMMREKAREIQTQGQSQFFSVVIAT